MNAKDYVSGKNVREMKETLFEQEDENDFVADSGGMLITGIAMLIFSCVLCMAVL